MGTERGSRPHHSIKIRSNNLNCTNRLTNLLEAVKFLSKNFVQRTITKVVRVGVLSRLICAFPSDHLTKRAKLVAAEKRLSDWLMSQLERSHWSRLALVAFGQQGGLVL